MLASPKVITTVALRIRVAPSHSQLQSCHILVDQGEAMADVTLSGRQLGDFRSLERIDEGGFGAVYRAEQQALERQAVVKVLHPGLACDPDLVQRFAREARLPARVRPPLSGPRLPLRRGTPRAGGGRAGN